MGLDSRASDLAARTGRFHPRQSDSGCRSHATIPEVFVSGEGLWGSSHLPPSF
ncbi:hypothetical protein P7K49_001763 [Saguinus oedipus]|uniref:Uncharacterized protein n=1 Tax=Saguinus oedipus TaxID=9490 RepID=A0ABQ9WFE8_SAGOE|nr:hypothetical protein P7K49_001763 [Saguinus oedipus]